MKNLKEHLKSNMDRFIGHLKEETKRAYKNLKSNMDRFIGCKGKWYSRNPIAFKIQYG